PVINSSAIGIFEKNLECKYYDNVYAGLNGIEGILNKNLLNLSEMPKEVVSGLKYTPSSGLGSCRYKLKNYENHKDEYVKLFEILEEYKISTFFYIG
ncbi:MAG TPA: 6-phosphofructokinase, partial [Clostridium sp.]|nr:6-phosphofructokinase [Clostridium sp.]